MLHEGIFLTVFQIFYLNIVTPLLHLALLVYCLRHLLKKVEKKGVTPDLKFAKKNCENCTHVEKCSELDMLFDNCGNWKRNK